MSTIYTRLGAMVTRLVDKYGQKESVIWQVNADGAPADPDMPWLPTENPPVQIPVTILFAPDERDQRETKNFTRRSTVPRGSQQAYMGPVSFEPSLKDTILRDLDGVTITYAIESIDIIRPSDASASAYIIRLK